MRKVHAVWALVAVLIAGTVLRLFCIGADGFANDISTFESWTLTLRDHGFAGFYQNAGFADYPPGYLYVLACLSKIYSSIAHGDPNFSILHTLVKLPGILADAVDAVLVYILARRIAPRYALWAAAAVMFNPATLAISAVWGQVDSVAAIGTLAAVVCMDQALRARPWRYTLMVAAWIALAGSIMIKPAPVVVAPFFLAAPLLFGDLRTRIRGYAATAAGIACSLIVVYLLALPFAPDHDFTNVLGWLYQRYQFGSNVYPYNSVNAFNLYAVAGNFWEPDGAHTPLTFGLPLVQWGAGLAIAAILTCAVRFAVVATPEAMIEGVMLASLAFFMFATRMHERYIFNGVLFALVLVVRSRARMIAAAVLSFTLCLNLYYSYVYLNAMAHPQPFVDPRDLIPWMSRPASLANVVVLLALGFQYLGIFSLDDQSARTDAQTAAPANRLSDYFGRLRRRRSFALTEGFAPLTRRDLLVACGLSAASFLFCLYQYWIPAEKIFDEIYYARSGAEYLKHIEQYEWTHPPFTKLVITLSMLLFGGIPHGDASSGWRFLNIVVGALMVGLLYCFVKRVGNSSFAATLAAGMLAVDGFHYVQSRIATPEITVACLSLLSLAAFYRYWTTAQIARVPLPSTAQRRAALPWFFIAALGALAGAAVLIKAAIHANDPAPQTYIAGAVIIVYLQVAAYLAVRLTLLRTQRFACVLTYADGSYLSDGGLVLAAELMPAGLQREAAGRNVHLRDERSGAALTFHPDGTISAEEAGLQKLNARRNGLHLFGTATACGLLAASKWNGLFDLLLIAAIMIATTVWRWRPLVREVFGLPAALRRYPVWGNPRGFPLDLCLAVLFTVPATIYLASYIPYFMLGHDLTDVIVLQHSMYAYHHDLRATHPYQSVWWQWPLLIRPISYYYADLRAAAAHASEQACCVSEILALPNPVIWWTGLVTIPLTAWFAYAERRKGYALIVLAYIAQWLPWIASPRIAFEYHFFPNLALICAANGLMLQRLWHTARAVKPFTDVRRYAVAVWIAAAAAAAVFWFPLVSGMHLTYAAWHARIIDWVPILHWI